MTPTVWLGVDTLDFPRGGGHLWAYLNWALGLRAVGANVVWLEPVEAGWDAEAVRRRLAGLRERLEPYGLADSIALCPKDSEPVVRAGADRCVEPAAAREADLLLNLAGHAFAPFVEYFKRAAVVDLDPGLLQMWMREKLVSVPPYDAYFTVGEGMSGAHTSSEHRSPRWEYTPPCVALDWWPASPTREEAAFTTVSSWSSEDWYTDGRDWYPNRKRDGFAPYLDLPSHTSVPLELALNLASDEPEERAALEARGWRVVHAFDVASTPWGYQRYVQRSGGEFSCAKPSSAHLGKAWISDRTLCFLASGKPAVIEYTGPSRFLPDSAGILRFRDFEEAVLRLAEVSDEYERHCRLARALAEAFFGAPRVLPRVLERCLS
jgi:hypothetical protein